MKMLLLRGDFICEKDFGSSYHMRISLIGSMHVGLIIIRDGESTKGATAGLQDEN